MIRQLISKKAIQIKEDEKQHQQEELLKTIQKTTELPVSSFKSPDEGTLICTSDPKDLSYLNSDDLIDPGINLYYYNSCLCKYNDGYRLFYRCGKNPKSCEDRIATCLLTKDLQVIPDTNKYINVFSNWTASRNAGPQTLGRNIRYFYPDSQSVKSFVYKDGYHVEDPRVIEFKGNWFVFYTDGMTVGVAKLDLDTCDVIYSHFLRVPPPNIIARESDEREKNWIPFVSNDQLFILYSDTPRTYIHCIDGGDQLLIKKYDKLNYIVTWEYGHIRGGCPPIEYDQNTLIWFFHSSKSNYSSISTLNNKIYFIGAYLTSKEYPFEVNQISIFPIFFGTPSPVRTNLTYQTNVVFPCGAVSDGGNFIVSMGINDYCIGHLKVFRKDIRWKQHQKTFTHVNAIKLF